MPPPSARSQVIGIVPYYSGAVGNDTQTGNAHSTSPEQVKLKWVVGTICSMLPWMGHVLAGTCTEEDKARLDNALVADNKHHEVHVQVMDCKQPVFLPYVLLRTAQHHLKVGRCVSRGSVHGFAWV